MKNDVKNLINSKLNIINNKYNLINYIKQYEEIEKTCCTMYEKICFNYDKLNDNFYKKYDIETLLKEAYTNIVKTILKYIFIDVIKIYVKYIKNKRDENDFLKMFDNYIFKFYINENYFEIYYNYDLKVKSYFSFSFEKDEKNNNILKIEIPKQLYNFYNSLNNEKFIDYIKRAEVENIDKIKENIINLQKIANFENKKIQNQIKESNEIIKQNNIYNLKNFVLYEVK